MGFGEAGKELGLGCGEGKGQEHRSALQAKTFDLVLQETEFCLCMRPAQRDVTFSKICVHPLEKSGAQSGLWLVKYLLV